MEIIIYYLMIVIAVLVVILIKKNERIRILENNWEVSKKIISYYDPEFAKYTKDK